MVDAVRERTVVRDGEPVHEGFDIHYSPGVSDFTVLDLGLGPGRVRSGG